MGHPHGRAAALGRALNRVALTAYLCDRGADLDGLAGNGLTPLDVAEARGARAVAALLEARGARRSQAKE